MTAILPRSPDFSMGMPISTARPWKDQRPKTKRWFICMGVSVSSETLKALVAFEEPGDQQLWDAHCEDMRTSRRTRLHCSDYPWTQYGPKPTTAAEVEDRRQDYLRKTWTVRAITEDLKRPGTLVPNRAHYDLEFARRKKASYKYMARGYGYRYQITLNRDDRPALVRRAGALVFSEYVAQLILRREAKRVVEASAPRSPSPAERVELDETWSGNPS